MHLAAAMVYWVIVAVWLMVLITIAVLYVRNPKTFGATRLLLAVLAIDTFRDVFENVYFGLYFGSQYGLFPAELARVLGIPVLLFVPKLLNVVPAAWCLACCCYAGCRSPCRSAIRHSGVRIAEEAARLKDEFTATVSHELRTPLTAIAASLALLDETDDLKASEEATELIAIAHANAQRLRRLVDDILGIEKLEAGKMVFRSQRIDLGRLLQGEIATSRPLAERSDVRLRLEAASDFELQTDPDRLKQVISNLLSNAIKFSPRGQEVLLSAEGRGNKVRISVSDRGSGVPQQFRSRIFQKFAQADMSDARQKTGTGLGPSIVKEIVERLGGVVGFIDAPGGGTIFLSICPSHKGILERVPPSCQRRQHERPLSRPRGGRCAGHQEGH